MTFTEREHLEDVTTRLLKMSYALYDEEYDLIFDALNLIDWLANENEISES